MASNQAAWAMKQATRPFQVKEAPMPELGPTQVLVRAAAWAVNPIDHKIQAFDFLGISYPSIFGVEVAGEVFKVGSSVTKVKPGDRIAAQCAVFQSPENGSYQLYPRVDERLTLKLPDHVDFATGATIPLGLSTATLGLYSPDHLALPYPSMKPEPLNKSILVWGGSSCVGTAAIQLAKLSGLNVVTTASPQNAVMLKALGADHVVDYHSPSAVDELVNLLKGKDVVGGFDAIGHDACVEAALVMARCDSGKKLVTVTPPKEGVAASLIEGSTLMGTQVGDYVWGFAAEAVDKGAYKPAVKVEVFGSGLESVQGACDLLKKGVSATKVVVTA